MDLAAIALGAFTCYVGLQSLKKGSTQVLRGLGRAQHPSVPMNRGDITSISRKSRPLALVYAGQKQATAAGRMKVTVEEVRNLDDRMTRIADMSRKGAVDPTVIAWARRALSEKCGGKWCVPEKDTRAEITRLYQLLRRDIRYTSDAIGVDTYSHPRQTLRMRAGDCDEYASTGCAALMSVGIPCRFKVIRTRDSNDWNHIYIQANTSKDGTGRWISLDASVPAAPGWEAPAGMVAASRIFEF